MNKVADFFSLNVCIFKFVFVLIFSFIFYVLFYLFVTFWKPPSFYCLSQCCLNLMITNFNQFFLNFSSYFLKFLCCHKLSVRPKHHLVPALSFCISTKTLRFEYCRRLHKNHSNCNMSLFLNIYFNKVRRITNRQLLIYY